MGDIRKREIEDASPEERPWPKRSIEVKPFSLMATTKLPLGTALSFRAWQKPSDKNLGDVEACNNNGGGVTSGASDDTNTPKLDEGQASQLPLGRNFHPNMDPKKLKQIMANRLSSEKSRLKKSEYMAELEMKAKSLQIKIGLLHPQVVAYCNKQRSLLIGQKTLKIQVAAREKERVLQEVEMEKTRAELNRLTELQRKQQQVLAHMLNQGGGIQLKFNSNSNPSGLARMIYSNSGQAQNGEEISKVDKTEQQEKQGQRLITNLGFVKSEL